MRASALRSMAAEGTAARSLGLRPVLSLRARVASVRDVAKGESVGYDRAFTARRKSRIAVLPIGYADGYPRALSNTGLVRIHGCLAPVAGRICMDQLAVDVTDMPGERVKNIFLTRSSAVLGLTSTALQTVKKASQSLRPQAQIKF